MSIIHFINKSLARSPKKDEKIIPTYSIPDMKEFHTKNNKLEAIVLLTTNKEINNGRFSKFINMLSNVTDEKFNVDFIISVNNNNHDSIQNEVVKLKLCFKDLYYYNINIDTEDDIYTANINFTPVPKYGLVSGPNILFIKTMKKLHKYNTVLALETDCILYKNWVNTLINYVEYSGDFLISGSTYDGTIVINPNEIIGNAHINGVALYKTGSNVFQFLLDRLNDYILELVDKMYIATAYDYVLCKLIFDKIKTSTNEEYTFWKVVYRYITKNTFIINASVAGDTNIPESVFLDRFPKCVVLHKKLE